MEHKFKEIYVPQRSRQKVRAKRIQIQIVNLAQIQNENTVQIRGLNVAAGIRNSQFRELFTFQQKD